VTIPGKIFTHSCYIQDISKLRYTLFVRKIAKGQSVNLVKRKSAPYCYHIRSRQDNTVRGLKTEFLEW